MRPMATRIDSRGAARRNAPLMTRRDVRWSRLSLHLESAVGAVLFVILFVLGVCAAAWLEASYPCRTTDDATGESRPTSCFYDDTHNPSTSRSPQ